MHSCQTVNCNVIDMSIYRIYYDVIPYAYLDSSRIFCCVFKQLHVCKSVQSHVRIVQSRVSQLQALLFSNNMCIHTEQAGKPSTSLRIESIKEGVVCASDGCQVCYSLHGNAYSSPEASTQKT